VYSRAGDTTNRYGVSGFPTYVLIDREGVVRIYGDSLPDRGKIEELLEGR
jgi:hypothetical protein